MFTKSSLRYLRIYINSHFKWSYHVKFVSAEASKTLNQLRNSLYACPQSVKATLYTCIVCPLLEYASPVWYLYSSGDIKQLEVVQCRISKWVYGSRWNGAQKCWLKSSDSCLNQLSWPSLHDRQKHFTICQLHSNFNNHSAIPFNKQFSRSNRHSCANLYLLNISTSTVNPH